MRARSAREPSLLSGWPTLQQGLPALSCDRAARCEGSGEQAAAHAKEGRRVGAPLAARLDAGRSYQAGTSRGARWYCLIFIGAMPFTGLTASSSRRPRWLWTCSQSGQ